MSPREDGPVASSPGPGEVVALVEPLVGLTVVGHVELMWSVGGATPTATVAAPLASLEPGLLSFVLAASSL